MNNLVFYDVLQRPINEGDIVAYSEAGSSSWTRIGKVKKITHSTLRIQGYRNEIGDANTREVGLNKGISALLEEPDGWIRRYTRAHQYMTKATVVILKKAEVKK